ncbi:MULTISPECIES: NAD(P)/FAD-dependent oxidoreductase [Klebsiella]|uniref:FAD-dependent oxidoreductase n=1 Tax=Klebsiella TaxID=570 RepID=UPI0007D0BD3C|nr:NAD(P)/FAD-dependent oxidoreductase [Klebsiella variicola]EKZ6050801.1 FAD-dependent monooxygenase [Klebsiella variicola]SBM97372.1 FAD-binding lipoprotein [Klebsiella variicola]
MKKVLIVGAGPVGLIIGCYLNKYGIDFDIIDKNTHSTTWSKALSVSPATIKAFHGLALAGELTAQGKQVQSIYAWYKNRKFLHIDNRHLPTCYPFHVSIPQPRTEQILETALAEAGQLVKRGHQLVSWRREEGRYHVSLLDDARRACSATYDYIIGADGAASTVRELAGIGFSGHDYPLHFVMADVQFASAATLPGTSYYIDELGFLIFLPMPDNQVRIVIKRAGRLPSPRPVPDLQEINVALARFCPEVPPAQALTWSSSANFYNRIADDNLQHNIMLAGDAFHLFSPIGGQGMNTGIQDAINLAWKLAFYLHGVASDRLLASYRTERFAAVSGVLHATDHDTGLIAGLVPKNHIDAVYFPEFCNRHYYRHQLPLQYAGFAAPQCAHPNGLMGHHVPWYVFTSPQATFRNSYDAFASGKVVVFSARVDCPPLSRLKPGGWFIFCALDPADEAFLEALQIGRDDYAVINPDGYVGFTGSEAGTSQYLSSLYVME